MSSLEEVSLVFSRRRLPALLPPAVISCLVGVLTALVNRPLRRRGASRAFRRLGAGVRLFFGAVLPVVVAAAVVRSGRHHRLVGGGGRRLRAGPGGRGRVVAVPVSALDGHHVAALVEDGAVVAHHARLEGAHQAAAVVRDPVAAVEAHLAVVRAVPVAHEQPSGVEPGEAVVALVARDLAQHAARGVSLALPIRGCGRSRRDADVCAAIGVRSSGFVRDDGLLLRVHVPQVVFEVPIAGHAVVLQSRARERQYRDHRHEPQGVE